MKIIESAVLKDFHPNEEEHDITEPVHSVFVVEMGKDTGKLTEDENASIRDYFRIPRCGCPGDCCGHRFGGAAFIRHLYGNRHIVYVTSQRNY